MNNKEKSIKLLKKQICSTCSQGFRVPNGWHCANQKIIFMGNHTCDSYRKQEEGIIKKFYLLKKIPTWWQWQENEKIWSELY